MNTLRVQPKWYVGQGHLALEVHSAPVINLQTTKKKEKKAKKKKVELVKSKEEKEKVGGQKKVWMNKRWVTIHKVKQNKKTAKKKKKVERCEHGSFT